MHRPTPKTGLELAEHIEMDHERELAALNTRQIKAMHADMHRQRDDWDHYHGRKR